MEEFCVIRIQRVTDGVKIYCKSKEIEEFFKKIAHKQGDIFYTIHAQDWEEIEGYEIDDISFNYAFFDQFGKDLLLDGNPNLSFLRAVGLANGVEFVAKGVYSLNMLHQFTEKAKVALQKFYTMFIKPVEIEVNIVKKTKETNNEDN